MEDTPSPEILFLTTVDPAEIKAEWPYYQNWTLPEAMKMHGAKVSIRCWQDSSLDSHMLASHDVVSFLWCNNYHNHGPALSAFIKENLIPAQEHSSTLRVINDAQVILWNMDKQIYLRDLQKAGFLIPSTQVLEDLSNPNAHSVLLRAVRAHNWHPIVLKPSISGSSKGTYLIRDPTKLSTADTAYLDSVIKNGTDGALLIQKYEPAIERGEYSLVFINGKHTHTILKTPQPGEFRCQGEFGGGTAEIALADVPADAVRVANRAMAYMQSRFDGKNTSPIRKPHSRPTSWRLTDCLPIRPGARKLPAANPSPSSIVYARIDGVIRDDGAFVLMEIEAIEPHLWLETTKTPGCREALYSALLGEAAFNFMSRSSSVHETQCQAVGARRPESPTIGVVNDTGDAAPSKNDACDTVISKTADTITTTTVELTVATG